MGRVRLTSDRSLGRVVAAHGDALVVDLDGGDRVEVTIHDVEEVRSIQVRAARHDSFGGKWVDAGTQLVVLSQVASVLVPTRRHELPSTIWLRGAREPINVWLADEHLEILEGV